MSDPKPPRGLPPGIAKRIRQVYRPPARQTGWSLEAFLGHDRVRYFSLGRFAFSTALRLAGVTRGDRVLLPEFICRELLGGLHVLGAEPVYYAVGKDLSPAADLPSLRSTKAAVAVNYFGFPQDMEPFRAYCDVYGAALIEDNAHGLLSRAQDGTPLGGRGDLGIFSLRKTLILPNGGALSVNRPEYWHDPPLQEAPTGAPRSASRMLKQSLRMLLPLVGVGALRRSSEVRRVLRRMRTGHDISPSAADSETQLPPEAAPYAGLIPQLSHVDEAEEVTRRRELYLWLYDVVAEAGGEPIFPSLAEGVAPYGFPFYAPAGRIEEITRALQRWNLECFPWPGLPEAVESRAPQHYKEAMLVSFLW